MIDCDSATQQHEHTVALQVCPAKLLRLALMSAENLIESYLIVFCKSDPFGSIVAAMTNRNAFRHTLTCKRSVAAIAQLNRPLKVCKVAGSLVIQAVGRAAADQFATALHHKSHLRKQDPLCCSWRQDVRKTHIQVRAPKHLRYLLGTECCCLLLWLTE